MTFFVPGIPKPQGSKRAFMPKGGTRPVMVEDANVKPWRVAIAWAAKEAQAGAPLRTGPLLLDVEFRFPRPLSHHVGGRADRPLRAPAPRWVERAPDLDKLVRAVGDALTGTVYGDDRQIVRIWATKVYADVTGAEITVEPEDRDAWMERDND